MVTRYNQTLMAVLKEDGLEVCTLTLTSEVKIHLTKTQQAEYEAIDKAATKYKRHIETKCHKLNAGTVPWCPQVSQAINCILYWKGMLSHQQGCAIGSSILRSQAKKASIDQHVANFTLEQQTI